MDWAMDYYAVLEEWRSSLEEVYRERSLAAFKAGTPIDLHQGEIWVVYRGFVQLSTIHAQGEDILLGIAAPSMPFGLPLTSLRPYCAQALTEVNLMNLSLAEIAASPQLSQGLFWHLVHRHQQTEAMLSVANYRRVEERLRQFLWLLKQELGQTVDQGTRLPFRLTHQLIASGIGSTRVTVTRLMGHLQTEGSLVIDPDRYLILTPRFAPQ